MGSGVDRYSTSSCAGVPSRCQIFQNCQLPERNSLEVVSSERCMNVFSL